MGCGMRCLASFVLSGTLGLLLPAAALGWQVSLGGDLATSVKIDAAGDVVAAGDGDPSGGRALRVAKFEGATGRKRWERLFGDIGVFTLLASLRDALALDVAGDVFASSVRSTLKLSGATGSTLWRTDISDPAFIHAIAVDPAGNVFVAAEICPAPCTNSVDLFVVIKYSGADGSELWRYTLGGNTSTEGRATAVTVDGNGNAVAEGLDQTEQLTVVKIAAADGSELWRQVVPGLSSATSSGEGAIAVDASGDVVAGGETGCGHGCDFTVAKLSGTDGTQIWQYVEGDSEPGGAPPRRSSRCGSTLPATWLRPGARFSRSR